MCFIACFINQYFALSVTDMRHNTVLHENMILFDIDDIDDIDGLKFVVKFIYFNL
jgi:hypothetical protein